MFNKAAVVICNKYPDVIAPLFDSFRALEFTPEILIVTSGMEANYNGYCCLPGIEPFCFARNANIGINQAPGKDIILQNDDTKIIQTDFYERLAEWTEKIPEAGIIAPLIDGGVGNPYQSLHRAHELWPEDADALDVPGFTPVCFVCAYLRRDMLNDIGSLDERFVDYGFEDDDLCIRARAVGWKTIIVKNCVIKHGTGGKISRRGENYSTSFARQPFKGFNIQTFEQKYHFQLALRAGRGTRD